MNENTIPPRHLPRHVLITRLKERRIRLREIADRSGVAQGTVSKVLARHLRGTPGAEAVWREVERALGPVA